MRLGTPTLVRVSHRGNHDRKEELLETGKGAWEANYLTVLPSCPINQYELDIV